jgi:hypothetical protein
MADPKKKSKTPEPQPPPLTQPKPDPRKPQLRGAAGLPSRSARQRRMFRLGR